MTASFLTFPRHDGPALHPALKIGGPKSLVHQLALVVVALTVVSGSFVFAEPAPVDVLTMGLIVGLPVIGLVTFTNSIRVLLIAWLIIAACHFMSAIMLDQMAAAVIHSLVSLYLFLACVVFTAFVARRPYDHAKLILYAYLAAAMIAAVAAILGYFSVVPGAHDLFTKFGRAAGPFKDPNVFGAFLIPAIVYALHLLLHGTGTRRFFFAGCLGLMSLTGLLSFSRGAWACTLIAVLVYLSLTFLTSKYHRQQLTIVAMVLVGGMLATLGILAAAQSDTIGDLLAHRAQLTHAYDQGHEGRFGGQLKALDLIVSHPFGLGAQEFGESYHAEEVHNVYLTMFLNAGWLGGGLFLLLMLATIGIGLRHAFRRTKTQPLFIVAFAAMVALILEGLLIDNDHWRHFYLMFAVVWGLMVSDQRIQRRPRIIRDRRKDLTSILGLPQPDRHRRAVRLRARALNYVVFYDVRGYSAFAYRPPRIIRRFH